jgi:hypothetical protein
MTNKPCAAPTVNCSIDLIGEAELSDVMRLRLQWSRCVELANATIDLGTGVALSIRKNVPNVAGHDVLRDHYDPVVRGKNRS